MHAPPAPAPLAVHELHSGERGWPKPHWIGHLWVDGGDQSGSGTCRCVARAMQLTFLRTARRGEHRRSLWLAVLLLLWLAPLEARPEGSSRALPLPPALEPNVRFWTRIYSEVDTQGGLIHDNQELDVIYGSLRFPSGASERERERQIDRSKRHYQEILRKLATGQRSGLTAEESRVLSRWPQGTSNASFRRATENLRFQLGQADKFRAGLIRQGAIKHDIEKTLIDHGVPRELVALPHVESSYNPAAYSRVGAAGLWQFMRSTGRLYLRIDTVVDERLDPFLASRAAARLLRDNYQRLDAWPLAITAYNHGPAGMARAVRALGTRDIGVIARRYQSRSFGFASRNFYSEFLAALEVDRNPEKYFGPLPLHTPVEYDSTTLAHYVPAASLASTLGVDLELLREHNPALRPSVWTGTKHVPKGFTLRVPKQQLARPIETALGQLPSSERLAQQHRDRLVTVSRGDTLGRIAARYGVTQRELAALNNLRNQHTISVGQVLILPDRPGASEPRAVAAAQPPAGGRYHVRRGDTLGKIAARHGVSERELMAWNGLSARNRNLIRVGQQILVAEPAAPAAQPVEAPLAAATVQPPAAAEPVAVAAFEAPGPEPALVVAANPAAGASAGEARSNTALESAPDTTPESAPAAPAPESAAQVAALASNADFERVVDAPMAPEESDTVKSGEDPAIESSPELSSADAPRRLLDPSNYAVTPKHTITVQADETLGHYAEWLELPASELRHLNQLKRGSTVVIGRSARLNFRKVSPETFERRRLEYHRTLQEEFFGHYRITSTETYVLNRGDTLWSLANQRYQLPVWLLRQYNPDLDFGALKPGDPMTIPRVESRDA